MDTGKWVDVNMGEIYRGEDGECDGGGDRWRQLSLTRKLSDNREIAARVGRVTGNSR